MQCCAFTTIYSGKCVINECVLGIWFIGVIVNSTHLYALLLFYEKFFGVESLTDSRIALVSRVSLFLHSRI